jgi:asparagine synthetase B (glutamine-hydrolysing)
MHMCSIAGFSLSNNSKINPRRLSHALLVEMDVRGNQASGFAWQSKAGSGLFKNDVAGARLNLKTMPKEAHVAVLHTRYATHGSIKVMANNHPVLSPDSQIALVHNGVIYNHNTVRNYIDAKLPEVDSSVIPALLSQYPNDLSKLEMLDGDASVAWLDEAERMTLKVARISHSPLCVAQLKDGSFVFASTESILMSALKAIGQKPIYLENVPERTLLTVRAGRLDTVEALPAQNREYEEKFNYSTSYYRNMTSGNKSDPTCAVPSAGGRYVASDLGDVFIPADWYDEEYDGDVPSLVSEFPPVENYTVNEFGEYFDLDGQFMGSFDDLVEMGYLPPIRGRRDYSSFADQTDRDFWD